MPRYALRTGPVDASARRRAVQIAARRFPEVEIEAERGPESPGGETPTRGTPDRDTPDRDTADCGTADRRIWVCRAPSAAHVRRWAAASGLPVLDLDRHAPPH